MGVLLTTAAFLVLFGFALFGIGYYTGYTAISVIGGLMIVGVGAMAVNQGGFDYRAGQEKTIVNETANKTVVNVDPQRKPLRAPINFPLQFLILVSGSLLSIQPLADPTD